VKDSDRAEPFSVEGSFSISIVCSILSALYPYLHSTFIPLSHQQNGIIGHHPEVKNLMLCNGFSGHGLQQSPAAGRAVSELISNSGKFETLDLRRFSFERILLNEGIHEDGIV
jgi:glycine/D-amino acid oxidase-like deaminating enzyme